MEATSLIGVSRQSGASLDGIEHLRQSIADILTTPVGSRLMRPDYGSDLPRIVDRPVNKGWMSVVQAEAVRAIQRWEPRLQVSRVTVESIIDGKVAFVIGGNYRGGNIVLEVTA